MAKQAGHIKLTGSMGGVIYYKGKDGSYQARERAAPPRTSAQE